MSSEAGTTLRTRSKTSELVDLLQARLLAGDDSGARGIPSEVELCRLYGTSRSTVREAVTVLVSRGLLERRHGVGLVAVNRTFDVGKEAIDLAVRSESIPLGDVLEIRRVLEVQSACWAAGNRSLEDVESMREAIQCMENPETTFEAYVEADLRFHLALAQAAGNAALMIMLQAVASSIRDLIRATVQGMHRPEITNGFHRSIFDAVEAGRSEEAGQRMGAHMRATDLLLGSCVNEGSR